MIYIELLVLNIQFPQYIDEGILSTKFRLQKNTI